jgi:D-serine dehydratase
MVSKELVLKPEEQEYFKMLFEKNLDVETSIKVLREQGIAASRAELVKFKQKALDSLLEQQKDEYMSELILTSFERTKLEFEEIIKETKSVMRNAEVPEVRLAAIRELRGQLETALNQQNKVAEQLIIAMKDKREDEKKEKQVYEVLKHEKERWLDEMGAVLTDDKKILLSNPTPEFIDFFIRWKFQKEMREGNVTLDV